MKKSNIVLFVLFSFFVINVASAITEKTNNIETYITSGVSLTSSTTDSKSKSVGGGSIGGSGVVTNELLSNIECSNRIEHNWRFDSTVTYLFRNCDEYDAIVSPKENELGVVLKLEILKDKSINVASAPSGSVYKYFNLYAGSKRLNMATIKFRVSPAWVFTMSSVVLQRWDGKEWVALDTKQVSANDVWVIYEAQTTTLSNFAVVGTQKPAELPAVTTPPPTPIATTITPTEAIIEPPEPPKSNQTIIISIAILGILLIIVMVLVIRKLRQEPDKDN